MSATSYDIGRLQLERERLDGAARTSAPTSAGSAASRPCASSPSMAGSASSASRSSSRRADRPRPTDAGPDRFPPPPPVPAGRVRRRLVALVARTAYWQVVRRLADGQAVAQTTVTHREPSRRGEIYDRTGIVLLATTVDRDRLVASADQLDARTRRRRGDALVRAARAGRGRREPPCAKAGERRSRYVILARGIEPDDWPSGSAAASPTGASSVIASSPSRCGSTRRPAAARTRRLAAHLLGFVNREGIGQYGVEQYYQDELAGEPRVLVAQRDASGRPILERRRRQPAGAPGEDLRLTIDAGLQLARRAGAPGGMGRGQGQERVGRRHGSVHRRDLRRGDLPVVRRQRLPGVAAADPARFIDPVVSTSTSRARCSR